jgi:hypothetical protein
MISRLQTICLDKPIRVRVVLGDLKNLNASAQYEHEHDEHWTMRQSLQVENLINSPVSRTIMLPRLRTENDAPFPISHQLFSIPNRQMH